MHNLIHFKILSKRLKQSKSPDIPGVAGPNLNVKDGKIMVTVDLEHVNTDLGITLPIPEFPDSGVSVIPVIDNNGVESGTRFQVELALDDIDNDEFQNAPSQVLPDGRPFPFLVDGNLPAFAIHVPSAHDTTFYVSEKVFGFFLPVTLPEGFKTDIHYRLKVNGRNYGIVSLIHADEAGQGAGVVLLLTIKELEHNTKLKNLLKYSKKRPNKLF